MVIACPNGALMADRQQAEAYAAWVMVIQGLRKLAHAAVDCKPENGPLATTLLMTTATAHDRTMIEDLKIWLEAEILAHEQSVLDRAAAYELQMADEQKAEDERFANDARRTQV